MNPKPLIAFCTTCKGRSRHLAATLPQNIADNRDYPNCKFVVLDYNSGDGLLPWLKENWNPQVSVYSECTAPKFRMAHAKNMAHRLGIMERADVLVNLDADNFTGPGFASFVARHFREHGPNSFLWGKMVQGTTPRGVSGRIAVSAQSFLKAGGYSEQYDAWGPDDLDFKTRLKSLGNEPHEIPVEYLRALRHPDKLRFREYPEAAPANLDSETAAGNTTETIANFGNVGCGSVYRNFGQASLKLDPIPTRIFGIGMHKTATTSLHMALRILGFDSAHWNNGQWARKLYDQVTENGRSALVEQHYAVSDLPIPLLYRELDKAYPGSKFILTIRGEQEWLNSVRNHWDPARNPWRSIWKATPFIGKLHGLIYGRQSFDADVFLARYFKHNDDALEYFSGREDDLLVMFMDGAPKNHWLRLCQFLRRPVPNVPYPRELVTR